MARPRLHDEKKVLDLATAHFWEHGYEISSISSLEEATGVSRSTIYNSWGDKQGLFIASLKSYLVNCTEMFNSGLNGNGLDGIIAFVNSFAHELLPGDQMRNGCFMVATAEETVARNPLVREMIISFRRKQINWLYGELKNSESRGEINCPMKLETAAEFIVGTLWGIFSTIRLYRDNGPATKLITGLSAVLESWKVNED